jgi:hypothetical protein
MTKTRRGTSFPLTAHPLHAMDTTLPSNLTKQHLTLFGAIVQWFARHELLIEEIMAHVAGTDAACVMLLTRDLNFSGKRGALRDLLRHREVPQDQFDQVYAHLLMLDTLGPLFNDILHSAWIPGKPSNSIQPDWLLGVPRSIRPLHVGTDSSATKFIERREDQVAYSVDDLREIVENLAENHERFSAYVKEVGLIGR